MHVAQAVISEPQAFELQPLDPRHAPQASAWLGHRSRLMVPPRSAVWDSQEDAHCATWSPPQAPQRVPQKPELLPPPVPPVPADPAVPP